MYSAPDSRLANRAIHQQRGSGMQPAWGNMRSQQAIAQPGLFLLHLILMLFLTSTFSPNFDLITYRMMYRSPGEGEREFIARARQVPRGWAVRDIQKWVTTENLASSLFEKTFMKFDFECLQAQPQVESREGSMSSLRHAHIPNALAYADARHSAPSFAHHADIQWNKYDVSNFLHFLQYNHVIIFRLSLYF